MPPRRVAVPAGHPDPCTGCRHFPRCSQEGLCCDAYAVSRMKPGASPERWAYAGRAPTRARYLALHEPRRVRRAE